MRHFYRILVLLAALFVAERAVAQISIEEPEVVPSALIIPQNIVIRPIHEDYFSPARYRAERDSVRKARNTLEIGGGLQGALVTQNRPWVRVSGGDNSIAVVATLYLHHIFTKKHFLIETRFDAGIGFNRMKVGNDNAWYKNQDAFALSVAPGFTMAPHWTYGANFAFRSQFANGFKERKKHQSRADMQNQFMTPAYLDMSLGVTYRVANPKWPFTIALSPVALSATYAERAHIRENYALYGWGTGFGIENPNDHSKYEGGSSIRIDYDRTFGKTGFFRYRTTLYSFYGWMTNLSRSNKISNYTEYKAQNAQWLANNSGDLLHADYKHKPHLPIHPTVRWTNTIDIKAAKFLTTTFSFSLLYDRAQNLDVQTQTLLSVGLTYTFKNK